jgi:hypothetical protein
MPYYPVIAVSQREVFQGPLLVGRTEFSSRVLVESQKCNFSREAKYTFNFANSLQG